MPFHIALHCPCLLNISGTHSHVGALTDGKTWKFFYVVEDEFYCSTILADNDQHIKQILDSTVIRLVLTLGILTLFAGGQFPTAKSSDPIWVQGKPSTGDTSTPVI